MHEITDAERTAWQRRAASCLGELLKLAAARHLPVLTWRIGTGPAVLGEASGSPAERRSAFGVWKAAIASVSGKAPEFDREHVFSGRTDARLTAGWKYLPVRLVPPDGPAPGVDVTLSASIWPEEEEGTDAT